MNQRIQELAIESEAAIMLFNMDGHYYVVRPEIKKFAELIVQECAAYLNGAMEVHSQRDQDLMDLAARKIKQHLGVE